MKRDLLTVSKQSSGYKWGFPGWNLPEYPELEGTTGIRAQPLLSNTIFKLFCLYEKRKKKVFEQEELIVPLLVVQSLLLALPSSIINLPSSLSPNNLLKH